MYLYRYVLFTYQIRFINIFIIFLLRMGCGGKAEERRRKGGGKAEEYQLGLKIQLTGIIKKRMYIQEDSGCYRIASRWPLGP